MHFLTVTFSSDVAFVRSFLLLVFSGYLMFLQLVIGHLQFAVRAIFHMMCEKSDHEELFRTGGISLSLSILLAKAFEVYRLVPMAYFLLRALSPEL